MIFGNASQDNNGGGMSFSAPANSSDDSGTTVAPTSAPLPSDMDDVATTGALDQQTDVDEDNTSDDQSFAQTMVPTPDSSALSSESDNEPTYPNTEESVDDKEVKPEDSYLDAIANEEPAPAPSPAPAGSDDLLSIKQQALGDLSPLVEHLDQTPEEKFRTTMMMIQSTDNSALIKEAYAVAQTITDDKVRAQALLDIVNEINYFTHQSNQQQ